MAAKNYVIRVIKDLKFLSQFNGEMQKRGIAISIA